MSDKEQCLIVNIGLLVCKAVWTCKQVTTLEKQAASVFRDTNPHWRGVWPADTVLFTITTVFGNQPRRLKTQYVRQITIDILIPQVTNAREIRYQGHWW
jgi:hypothetical protein